MRPAAARPSSGGLLPPRMANASTRPATATAPAPTSTATRDFLRSGLAGSSGASSGTSADCATGPGAGADAAAGVAASAAAAAAAFAASSSGVKGSGIVLVKSPARVRVYSCATQSEGLSLAASASGREAGTAGCEGREGSTRTRVAS